MLRRSVRFRALAGLAWAVDDPPALVPKAELSSASPNAGTKPTSAICTSMPCIALTRTQLGLVIRGLALQNLVQHELVHEQTRQEVQCTVSLTRLVPNKRSAYRLYINAQDV